MLAFAVMSKAHTLTGPTFVGHSRVICYAHPICIRPLETDQVVALEVDSGKSQWLAIPLGLLGASVFHSIRHNIVLYHFEINVNYHSGPWVC